MLNVENMEVIEYPIEPPFLTFDFSEISQSERDMCEKAWKGEFLTAFDAVAITSLYHLFKEVQPVRVKYQGEEYFFHSVLNKINGGGADFYPVILSKRQ